MAARRTFESIVCTSAHKCSWSVNEPWIWSNPCLPEGQWNSFDFVFEAPKFEAEKLLKPAYITLFFNGVMVHNKAQLLGTTSHEPIAVYTPHAPELPLSLQGHVGPAWYRNIWVRRLLGYDA